MLEPLWIRSKSGGARNVDLLPLEALESMAEHGAVLLAQDVLPHFHDEVGANAEEVPIEGGMMEFAQRESIGDDRCPIRLGVRDDVSRIEKP